MNAAEQPTMPKKPTNPVPEKIQLYRASNNKARRARYENDPQYRALCMARANDYKAKSAIDRENCRENLSRLWSIGKARVLGVPDGQTPGQKQLTFSYSEMAEAIGGYSNVCLRSWIQTGLFPKPIYKEQVTHINTGPPKNLYTEKQAIQFIHIFAAHQDNKHRKLRAQDAEVVLKLLAVTKPKQP